MSTISTQPAAAQSCETARALSAPFEASEVKFKPAKVSGSRALAIAYIDARAVMDRLDDVLGVDAWKDRYTVLSDGSVMCQLALRLGDTWVVKADVGSQSEQPDEGDRMKAAFSDALKRAAVKFGIGRYLYRLPAQWVHYDPQKRQFVKTPRLPGKAQATAPAAMAPAAAAPKPAAAPAATAEKTPPATTKSPVAPKETPATPPTTPAKAEPIGSDGAQKLLALASKKRVRLEDHLAAAGVSQFQPLSEVSKEVGRKVYQQLQQLPDSPAVMPPPNSPPANGQATDHTTSSPTATATTPATKKATCPF